MRTYKVLRWHLQRFRPRQVSNHQLKPTTAHPLKVLTGVHLAGVHLSSQACISQACISSYRRASYRCASQLTGVHLTGLHLTGVDLSSLLFIPVSSEADGPWLGLDMDNGELVLLCRRNIDFL